MYAGVLGCKSFVNTIEKNKVFRFHLLFLKTIVFENEPLFLNFLKKRKTIFFQNYRFENIFANESEFYENKFQFFFQER